MLDASNVSAISNNALINRTDKLDLSESKMSELERSHYLIARKLQTMLMQDGIPQSASGLSADDVGVQLRISNDALFKPGSADFSPVALKVLDGVLGILREYNLYLVIRGHADSEEAVGSPYPSGWELSAARAAARGALSCRARRGAHAHTGSGVWRYQTTGARQFGRKPETEPTAGVSFPPSRRHGLFDSLLTSGARGHGSAAVSGKGTSFRSLFFL